MRLSGLFLLAALTGCSFYPRDSAPPVTQPVVTSRNDPAPRQEPRSRYGNPSSYVEFGKRYHVLASADGYHERGIASWYGQKFHGRRTSSGDTYDMYAMTAAHKTLPLPTWVEVRNLKNDKRIVVRVNDRGPFVANRIIDLSYEAARRLEIVRDGTGLVEVTALVFDANGGARVEARPEPSRASVVRRTSEPAPPPTAPTPLDESPNDVDASNTAEPDTVPPAHTVTNAALFVQVGAFASLDNAEGMFIRLRETGFSPVDIVTIPDESPPLYRVRVGPLRDATALDAIVTRLQSTGIGTVQVIVE
ncbi:MAG: septal ring lytic transglycosylase RlpA family protein [Pseudomonadota bacterium]